jgi:HD domain
LTVYAEDKAHYVFKSSITGKAIERASIRELEEFLAQEYPDIELDRELQAQAEVVDPYPVFRLLLLPLENVRGSARWHPEGDVLYHSLQVFEQARDRRPYDVEFLQAALLHDVGKGIEPYNHVEAGLQALEDLITARTQWLIANHMHAHDVRNGTIGGKLKRELQASPDFEDLMLLNECDDAGRERGAVVGTVDEALDYLRDLERQNEGEA